jgi:putative hydrolase of the HAD superfamily
MYKHIFFDLDETLWDYYANASAVLQRLYIEFDLVAVGVENADVFTQAFYRGNNLAWHKFDIGEFSKETLRLNRFALVFAEMNLPATAVPDGLEEAFVSLCPREGRLIEGTIELLEYLKPKYTLHIITNGFNGTQALKMESAGIDQYFATLTTSESNGSRKPMPEIYEYALASAGAAASQSMMVGDKIENDVLAAERVGIHGVYYNPHSHPHTEKLRFEIKDLLELKEVL